MCAQQTCNRNRHPIRRGEFLSDASMLLRSFLHTKLPCKFRPCNEEFILRACANSLMSTSLRLQRCRSRVLRDVFCAIPHASCSTAQVSIHSLFDKSKCLKSHLNWQLSDHGGWWFDYDFPEEAPPIPKIFSLDPQKYFFTIFNFFHFL